MVFIMPSDDVATMEILVEALSRNCPSFRGFSPEYLTGGPASKKKTGWNDFCFIFNYVGIFNCRFKCIRPVRETS
jgi:hypothetical protein